MAEVGDGQTGQVVFFLWPVIFCVLIFSLKLICNITQWKRVVNLGG